MSADREAARRGRQPKGYKQRLVNELREHIRNGVPHDLHFKPTAGMGKEQRDRLQAALDDSYRIWAETWLYP